MKRTLTALVWCLSLISLLAAPTVALGGITRNSRWQEAITLGVEYPSGKKTVSYGDASYAFQPSKFASSNSGLFRTSSPILGMDEPGKMGGGDKAAFRYSVGIPFVSVQLFGWAKYNRNNEFIGFRGISYGIGFYSKNYYNPPKKHGWNTFWHWGTFYLLIPFIGVGTEFTTDNFFFEVGTIYIIPYPGIGIHF